MIHKAEDWPRLLCSSSGMGAARFPSPVALDKTHRMMW